jgi:hypothetical protein
VSRFKRSLLLLVAYWLGLQSALVANENPLAFPPPSHLPISPSSHFLSADSSLPTKSPNCPADLETLTSWLLRDLPSYANRVMQRSRRLSRTVDSFSYVVVAGRPEFEPLSLGPGQYTPADPATEVEPPQQVFFTTLERQYRSGKAINTQLYHWVFLTQTPDGWRLAMMFSRIGSSSAGRPPTPPRESSNGVVGQGVSTWLRDCRAGAIRPPRVRPSTQKTG